MGGKKLVKKIMSIQAFPSIYISIYTLIEMIFLSHCLLQKQKYQLWGQILLKFNHSDLLWSKIFAFSLDLLSLRSDSFVGKDRQIKVLESMTKFIAASAEPSFAVGVLQLIFMAGRSSQCFTLLPLCVPYNPLLKRVLLMNSQLHYPCCGSRSKSTQRALQVRISAKTLACNI